MVRLNVYISSPGDSSARTPSMYVFRVEGLNYQCQGWMASQGNYSREVFCGASRVKKRLLDMGEGFFTGTQSQVEC